MSIKQMAGNAGGGRNHVEHPEDAVTPSCTPHANAYGGEEEDRHRN